MNASNKDRYIAFCEKETSIPLFSRSWWLDAVAGQDNWDVALVLNGDEIFASMPYVTYERYGFTLIKQPPFTQVLGPWLRETNSKYAKRLGQEKDWLQRLMQQLPRYHYFSQCWHHSQRNWLPFYWAHYEQTTQYTYILNNLKDHDRLWSGLQENIRTDIRKATNRFKVIVRQDLPFEYFLKLNKLVFKRQGRVPPYTEQQACLLDEACVSRKARKLFIAVDELGQYHAGVYIVWDEKSAYYLLGGGDPALRNSGATSLCMWEAIKFASTVTEQFDFEGSMMEPVERYFRAFGAQQIPYFRVYRMPSRVLRTGKVVRDLIL